MCGACVVVVCCCCRRRLHAGFRTYALISIDIRSATFLIIKKTLQFLTRYSLGLCVKNALFNESAFFFRFKYSGRKVKSLLM